MPGSSSSQYARSGSKTAPNSPGQEKLHAWKGEQVESRAEFYYEQFEGLAALRQEARRELLAESRKHSAVKLPRQILWIGLSAQLSDRRRELGEQGAAPAAPAACPYQ